MKDEVTMIKTAIINAGYAVAMYIGINVELLGILFVVMVFDIVTGVAKSIRDDGKHSFTSHRLCIGIISKLMMLGVPILIALGLKSVNQDGKGFIDGIIGVLTLSEVYSSIGNIYSFKTGKNVKEIDALSWILGSFRAILENIMKKPTE